MFLSLYPNKFGLDLEKLDDPETKGRIMVLEWHGEKLLGKSFRTSTVPNTQYEQMKLSFEWHPYQYKGFNRISREQFGNETDYWREYEKIANEIINQFTDEELFIVVSRRWNFEEYKEDSGYNHVNRNFFASYKLHPDGRPAVITVEVEFLTRASSSDCYITTAICSSENKPDDCYELETFRSFRDNWLANQADGKYLINEYYDTAPRIVKKIDASK